MAVWNGKDFLSTKYTTAVIMDKNNRAYSVEIKNTIDEYFTVTISKQRYVFRLNGQRKMTWRHLGRKQCQFYLYTIDHYLPMSPQDNAELEMVLRENSLPKVSNQILDLFNYLGKREKSNVKNEQDKIFQEHDLDKIIELVAQHEGDYPEASINLKNFFERLDIKKIVTPVKSLSEFLEGDLKTTDAKIFGDLESQVKRTEKEQKAMSNTVKDAKKNWLVIGILGLLIGGGVIFALYAYSTGAFDHIVPQLPGSTIGSSSGPPKNLSDFAAKYPTCEKLQTAIDNGDIKIADVPQVGKDMLKNCHNPAK